MNYTKINFLSIPVDALTMQQTVNSIDRSIQNNRHIQHVVINAAKVVSMQTHKDLYDSVVHSDLINADGQSIVWAARFVGKQFPERVTGIDLMENLVKLASQKGYKCFFFGAREEVVGKMVSNYSQKYGAEIIAGYRNGYYTKEEEISIAEQINESGANMLFVGMCSPQKEVFLSKYKNNLQKINFTMGVGGSFDVIAGFTSRAPGWIQKIGMEWFFRFMQEPKRMWKRYLIGNYLFIKLVFQEKFKKEHAEDFTYSWYSTGSY
jgi:N-acetylglucosaminyldiphosphoundecaprenol N-acetyl-beta-D-mannosaminyltransferase